MFEVRLGLPLPGLQFHLVNVSDKAEERLWLEVTAILLRIAFSTVAENDPKN